MAPSYDIASHIKHLIKIHGKFNQQLFEFLDENTEDWNDEFFRTMADECMARNKMNETFEERIAYLHRGGGKYGDESWKSKLADMAKKDYIQFDNILIYYAWTGRGVRELFPAMKDLYEKKWKYPHFNESDTFGQIRYKGEGNQYAIDSFYEARVLVINFINVVEASIAVIESINKKLRTKKVMFDGRGEGKWEASHKWVFGAFNIERKAQMVTCRLNGFHNKLLNQYHSNAWSLYNTPFIDWFNKYGPSLQEKVHKPFMSYWLKRFLYKGEIELDSHVKKGMKMWEADYPNMKLVLEERMQKFEDMIWPMIY
jgi:hypothetical protein